MEYPGKRTPDQRDYLDLTITTETDGLSPVGDLGGMRVAAIEMSAAWTAADLAFKGSFISSANMYDVHAVTLSSGSTAVAARLQLPTTASRILALDEQIFDGIRFIQLESLAAGGSTAITQAAARTVRLALATPNGPLK